jgi:hypothetical protein
MNASLVIAVVFLATATATAARAEMPVYDVEAHCEGIASFGGASSQSLLNACLRQEQSAYDHLKPSWDALPSAMRSHCDEIARFGGPGSFSLLDACVSQERTAAKENAQFKFKR